MTEIYLDHAADTQPSPQVTQAMCQAMQTLWGNPSSPHASGTQARKALNAARRELAALIGAAPNELVFTSGGTESNALALYQAAGRHVVLSAIEHSSVGDAAKHFDCEITTVLPDSDGIITADAIARAIRPDTALISVQAANNETGVCHPIAEIGRLAKQRGILFHCDAVQGFVQLHLDVTACGIDLLSASAHKLYGPKGIGLLYLRGNRVWKPLIPGSQNYGMRGGTEDLPGICGFRVAAAQYAQYRNNWGANERELRTVLENKLLAQPGVAVLCRNSPRLPGILSVLLPGISAEEAIAKLDLMGIRVSGGAACAAASAAPSHVLTALGLSAEEARRVIRISLGKDNTPQEMEYTAQAILSLCK